MNNNLQQTASALAERLQRIDYDSLTLSDYNKSYIRNLKPALPYYMKIYADCLSKGIAATGLEPEDMIFVDYGGGSGFLSMLAKEAGIGKVIYIDLNPRSVTTVGLLKQKVGTGPDVILHGDTDELLRFCYKKSIKPHFLMATDLIEHVYDLEFFFDELMDVSDSMYMVFTTASTPFNPYVVRRLRKAMVESERDYYILRHSYIKENYPDFTEEAVDWWSRQTRGLVYWDISEAIDHNFTTDPTDPYNTCDPSTGNWTERILPIETYRSILARFGYSVDVEKGFYNTERSSVLFSLACRAINKLIAVSGKTGFIAAPFIILTCRK